MEESLVWYLHDSHTPIGPMTLKDLESQLQLLTDWKSVQVWRDGYDDWVDAGVVHELRRGPPPIRKKDSKSPVTQLLNVMPPDADTPRHISGVKTQISPETLLPSKDKAASGGTVDFLRPRWQMLTGIIDKNPFAKINNAVRTKLWLRVVALIAVTATVALTLVWESGSVKDRIYITAFAILILRLFILPLVVASIVGALLGWITLNWRRAWSIGRRSYAIVFALIGFYELWALLSPGTRDAQALFVFFASVALLILGRAIWNWPSDVAKVNLLPNDGDD